MVIGPDFVFLAVPRTASQALTYHFLPKYGGESLGIDDYHRMDVPPEHAQKFTFAVVLHDCVGQSVWDGVQHLIDNGFKFQVYNTPQMLTVCWRGEIEMPVHVPDPAINWTPHLAQMPFDWSEES